MFGAWEYAMTFSSAFAIGRSTLTAAQIGIQTTGNNVANAATPGYSRQTVSLAGISDARWGGQFIGRGVEVQAIRRHVDQALQQRLWSSLSSENAAATDLRLLSGVETTLNALGETNVGSQMSRFFNAWSELANAPGSQASKSVVVQQGAALAGYLRQIRADLVQQQTQTDRELRAQVTRVNDLLGQIAQINSAVVTAENGQGTAGALRDRRDQIVSELAGFIDLTTIEQANGALDVLAGSTPVVLAGRSRGVEFRQRDQDGTILSDVVTLDRVEALNIRGGSVGSLLAQRDQLVGDTIERLDRLSTHLIDRVNRIYSDGLSGQPMQRATGTTQVRSGDYGLAFSDPANQTFAAMKIRPTSGSFQITVEDPSGSRVTRTVTIDTDGITAAGTPGYTNDTSINALVSVINALGIGATATMTGDGRFEVSVPTGYALRFGEDSSGILSALGVNTFFQGQDARDIAVRPELLTAPATLNAARITKAGAVDDSGVPRAIAQLRDATIAGLGGVTFASAWDETVQGVAVRTGAARTSADSTRIVRESLEAQRSAVSGVSLDEEAINLVNFQRQYQAGARYISVLNEMTQTLLSLV